MGSKYAALVEAAQKNAKSVWVLADELLSVCPNRSRDEIQAAHAVLCDAGYEYSPDRLRTLAYTAERWPREIRCLEASFKVHEVLNPRTDRAELIQPNMTLTQAHKVAGHSTSSRTLVGDGGSPAAEAVSAMAEDRDAMRSLVNDPKFRSAFVKEYAEQESHDREEAETSARKRAPGLERTTAIVQASSDLNHAKRDVVNAIELLKDEKLGDADRDAVISRIDLIESTLGWLRDLVTSGSLSWGEELENLLRDSA